MISNSGRVMSSLVVFFFNFTFFIRKCTKREISKTTTKNENLLKALILDNLFLEGDGEGSMGIVKLSFNF